MMYSVFLQTDYDLYVNHLMASQSSLVSAVKHTIHNIFMMQLRKMYLNFAF